MGVGRFFNHLMVFCMVSILFVSIYPEKVGYWTELKIVWKGDGVDHWYHGWGSQIHLHIICC